MFLGVWITRPMGGAFGIGCKIKPTEVNIGFPALFQNLIPYTH